MNHLGWRTQLAVLWLLQTVNYVAIILIAQVETGLFGTLEPGSSGMPIAVFFFIPSLLAWLSFALKPSVSRWLHIVFGLLFAVLKLIQVVGSLSEEPSPAFLLNEVWGLIAAGLILWCAIRLPKSDLSAH